MVGARFVNWPVVVVLMVLGSAEPQRAAACASCACGDPTLTTIGLEKPFRGRFRVANLTQVRNERQGGDRSTEWRTDLSVSYAPAPRLTLLIQQPFVGRMVGAPNGGTIWTYGPGDLEAGARVTVWQDSPFLPEHLLGLQAVLRLPTAPAQQLDGATDLAYQLGFGAVAPQVGMVYGYYGAGWSLFASTRLLVPIDVGLDRDETVGASWLTSTLLQWQPLAWLAVQSGVDLRASAPNRTQSEQAIPNTGGFLPFAALGAAVTPWTDFLVSASVRIPVDVGLQNGSQAESPMVWVGLSHDWALGS